MRGGARGDHRGRRLRLDQPARPAALESYFRGLLLVPERELFVARLDGTIVGSAQLVRPPRNNEAQAFAAHLMHSFVAPYARGHGLARLLTAAGRGRRAGARLPRAEPRRARDAGGGDPPLRVLGYVRWGTHPHYARVAGQTMRGFHYYKLLKPAGKV